VSERVRIAYAWMRQNPVTLALMIAVLAAAVAINAERRNDSQDVEVTKIQKTPCNKNPSGEKCADLRLEVARAEPLRNPCASYQRVTSRRGRNCERFYVRPGRELRANSKSVQSLDNGSGEGGRKHGAGGPISTPSQPADSAPHAHSKSPGKQPQAHQPVPTEGGGDAPTQLTSSTGSTGPIVTPAPATTEEASSRGLAPAALEAAGEKVGEVVDKAEDAVSQVGCTVRSALKPCP
jgi:hypothetical protein